MRRRLLTATVLGSGALLGASLHPTADGSAAAASSPSLPVFAHPVTVDAQRMVGEPDATAAADGRIYVSAPWGVTTHTSFIWRSEDGGESFRQIQAAPGVQNPYPFRAGGDTEIQAFPPAGPAVPGEPSSPPTRLYFADQNNLDSNTCGYSADAGRSFQFTGGALCPQSAGADRQWLTVAHRDPAAGADGGLLDHDVSYLWYDHVGQGSQLFRSDDGQNYGSSGVTMDTGADSGGNPGNAVADRATGVVYVTGTSTSADGNDNGVQVAYSADGGKTLHTVQAVPDIYTGNTGTDFSVLAIDDAGNLYVTWSVQNGTAEWQTFLSHTTGSTLVDNGVRSVPVAGATAAQWSAPIPLNGAGTGRPDLHYAVFPWLSAGDPGRVDIVYYGTDAGIGYDPNSQDAKWSTYMAQTLDGLSATPTFTTVSVAEAPTHLHSICFNGIGCTGTGNRNMLDFFEVRHDNTGAAVVAYDDDANSLTALFPGGPQVMLGRQVGGPSLYAAQGDLGGSPTPDTAFVSDRSGDGTYPTSDQSVKSLDLLGAGATLKDPSTVEVTFKVADLTNAVAQIPPSEAGTAITYVLAFKHADDLWFVAAEVDASGTFNYTAGRPQSVPFTATGGPKYAEYSASRNASLVSGGTADTATGTITVDVPTAMLGGLTSGDRLLQATGFSLVEHAPPHVDNLADQADATPSFDDTLGQAPVSVPETPWAPAVLLLGAVAVAVGSRRRRRRRRGHAA